MIQIRTMVPEDLPLFQKWLHEPHVAKWYYHPDNWIEEIVDTKKEFTWIHHYIVESVNDDKSTPIGFCQYYSCHDSGEEMEGYTKLGGVYSIDYLIGEVFFLRKGNGKKIVQELENKITNHTDAKYIVVQPDKNNIASRSLLRCCGYSYDNIKDIFIKTIR
jgi:RimJ/RimL family protein N-acetyltransferase